MIKNMLKSNYCKPTPIQMQTIPVLMNRRNLLALSPTGSGKTLAFAIPILTILKEHEQNGLRAIVFAPTMELAGQIYRESSFLGFGLNNLKIKLLQKISTETKNFSEHMEHIDLLITTPLKFLKLFSRVQKTMENPFKKLQFVVFDETDKYFELGMARQIKQIISTLEKQPQVNYCLFSATIQNPVEDLMKTIMVDPIKIQLGGRNHVLSNIHQKLVYCQSEFGKLLELKTMINQGQLKPPAIIFVQSKERAHELYTELQKSSLDMINLQIDYIDANRHKQDREKVISDFRTGKIWVLICTDLISRGIDFKKVNLVINYDFPNTAINYIHRCGRTGRNNQKGTAVTFFTDLDKPLLKTIGNLLSSSGCEVPDWVLQLKRPKKKNLKRLAKFPSKREHISQEPELHKNLDAQYYKQLAIAEKKYKKTQQEHEQEEPQEEDSGEWVQVPEEQSKQMETSQEIEDVDDE